MALSSHPKYPFIVAANRDEFYARPTAGAAFWEDAPHVLAGRDLREGGTWLGVSKDGRFAAVTNYRGPDTGIAEPVSRGRLVGDYLRGDREATDYLARVARAAQCYRGFNLVAGTGVDLHYYGNRDGAHPRPVEGGVHGLSNHLLDTPWPKVERAKAQLRTLLADDTIDTEAIMDLLYDQTRADAEELPDTGVGVERERQLSPIFIRTETYGTRSSTLVMTDTEGEVSFIERTYVAGRSHGQQSFQFRSSH
jgi:uncharacterized protein with NRDE domain